MKHRIAVLATSALMLVALASSPAAANPTLGASTTTLSTTGSHTMTVTGRGYLVPPHAPGTNVFGGVYVFFGWVRPGAAWGPSVRNSNNNDGNYGSTYNYAGDEGDPSTRTDNGGTMRFVSFTAGGTSGESTDYHMDDNGNWTTTLVVPGPVYQYTIPATGESRTVDCRVVVCGVFTIGAHGKASATNERFTPISFSNPTPPPTSGGSRGNGGGGAGNTGGGGDGTGGAPHSVTPAPAGGANGNEPGGPGATVPGTKKTTGLTPKTTSTTIGDKQARRGPTPSMRPESTTTTPENADAPLALAAARGEGGGDAGPWVVGSAVLVVLASAGAGASIGVLRKRAGATPAA